MNEITKEQFKNLEAGDKMVSRHGNTSEVLSNNENSSDLYVRATCFRHTKGFRPVGYHEQPDIVKIIKKNNEKDSKDTTK